MDPTFEALGNPPGLAVVDRVERQRYRFDTPAPVDPVEAPADVVDAPVDAAVRFQTEALELPSVVPVYVRDDAGRTVAEVTHLDEVSLPAGTYTLDLGTQVKSYLAVEGALEVSADLERTRVAFDGATAVSLGARSSHERPATTVTTTSDPEEMMRAVETFGSALKTLGPERSYPTLRGHPPAVELGAEPEVPDDLHPPDSGVTIHLPRTLAAVYAAAPLAYYLGASVRPGATPRVTTTTGYEYDLDTGLGFEREVARTLKRCFLLDCVVRSEGTGPAIHERPAVEAAADVDLGALYEATPPERVAAYLSVSHDAVAEYVPEWRLVTHVDPTPTAVEGLPFVVDDLAVVRTRDRASSPSPGVPAELDREFTRDDVVTRSAADDGAVDPPEFVEPSADDSLEQAWLGDSVPIGASKLSTDAFQNRLDRDPTDGDISINVVENDPRMSEERDLVDAVYGDRDDLSMDVTVLEDLTTEELAAVLRADADFFHYIGHTDRDGFRCSDGKLDVGTMDAVGVDTFLLNACNSYHQGQALVENGAIGGIVTLNEIVNSAAVEVGELVARLLNAGFPLRAALTIAREESYVGAQYIVVGDGGVTVAQPASGAPNMVDVVEIGDSYEVEMQTFATDDHGLGTVITPYISDNDEYYINSGTIDSFEVSPSELHQFLQLEEIPVRFEGDLCWSTSLTLEELN